MFLKGTLTSRKDRGAVDTAEVEAAAVEAATAACMTVEATAISVSGAADMEAEADAGIRGAVTEEVDEEEGNLLSSFIFY